jgi:hypothetical protein
MAFATITAAMMLRWPVDLGRCEVRFIEVPPELHARYAHGAALPLYQMIAKNVGIRRARGHVPRHGGDSEPSEVFVRVASAGELRRRVIRHRAAAMASVIVLEPEGQAQRAGEFSAAGIAIGRRLRQDPSQDVVGCCRKPRPTLAQPRSQSPELHGDRSRAV